MHFRPRMQTARKASVPETGGGPRGDVAGEGDLTGAATGFRNPRGDVVVGKDPPLVSSCTSVGADCVSSDLGDPEGDCERGAWGRGRIGADSDADGLNAADGVGAVEGGRGCGRVGGGAAETAGW